MASPLPALLPDGPAILQGILTSRQVLLHCSTWNLHGKTGPDDLTLLLPANRFHVYAVGTQECERTIVQSVVFPATPARWEGQLAAALGSGYFLVGSSTLGATHLAVFAHVALAGVISDRQVTSVPCGWGNTLGNKGGVAVTFNLGQTSFLVVNAHLAASQGNVLARNANVARIEAAAELLPALHGLEARLQLEQRLVGAASGAAASTKAGQGAPLVQGVSAASPAAEADDHDSDDELPVGSPALDDAEVASNRPRFQAAPTPAATEGESSASVEPRSPAATSSTATIPLSARYDRVIFMGDLNYRVDVARAEADAALAEGRWQVGTGGGGGEGGGV